MGGERVDDDWYARLSKEPPDKETRRINLLLEQSATGVELDVATLRRNRAANVAQLPEAEERFIPSVSGQLKLRLFVPAKTERVYLHLHDGAWVMGGAHMQDWLLKALSERCNAVVASVDYRLAPEHPYPAAPDDAETAALWLAQHAKSEFGTDCLTIGGESAGAHLAVVSLLRLRDKHGFRGFSAANLNYGCFDLGLTPSARNAGARSPLINTPLIQRMNALFVQHEVDRRDPDISPLYAELDGLPPALFTVGTLDPFLDDSLFMHARWLAAGNAARLALYPGCVHAFNFFPLASADQSLAEQAAFLTNAGPA